MTLACNGMGIGTATSILVFAGRHEGYHVQFSDKKGLAIRNGSVYSQLVFSKHRQPDSMSVAQGQADLLLGVDLLDDVLVVGVEVSVEEVQVMVPGNVQGAAEAVKRFAEAPRGPAATERLAGPAVLLDPFLSPNA